MLARLDPVATLPYLAVDNIWQWLSETDLLHCRLVSTVWKDCVDNSRQWKRYLPDNVASDWHGYFGYRKADTSWRRGIFQRNTISVTPNDKICVGEEFIYVGRDKHVAVYNKRLDVVRKLILDREIISLECCGKMLVVVIRGVKSKYSLQLYRNLEEVYSAEASSTSVGLNKDGKLGWVKDKKVYLLEGKDVEECDISGEVRSIVLLERSLVLIIGHPASRGGGFTVLKSHEDCWRVLYECTNTSPMVMHFGYTVHNYKALAMVHGSLSESGYSYRIFVLTDVENVELRHIGALPQEVDYPYFLAAVGSDAIIYTFGERDIARFPFQEGSIMDSAKLSSRLVGLHIRQRDQILVHTNNIEYWKDLSFRYGLDFQYDIVGSAVQDRAVIVWGKDHLTALSIP